MGSLTAWKKLNRRPRYQVQPKPRARPENVKEQIVRQREFENIRLIEEEVAEFEYQPTACKKTYRMIVVKKYLEVSKGQSLLFRDYRYFFYLTNDRELSPAEVVFEANDRSAIKRTCWPNSKARCGRCTHRWITW